MTLEHFIERFHSSFQTPTPPTQKTVLTGSQSLKRKANHHSPLNSMSVRLILSLVFLYSHKVSGQVVGQKEHWGNVCLLCAARPYTPPSVAIFLFRTEKRTSPQQFGVLSSVSWLGITKRSAVLRSKLSVSPAGSQSGSQSSMQKSVKKCRELENQNKSPCIP